MAEWKATQDAGKSCKRGEQGSGRAVAERNRLYFLVEPAQKTLEKLADDEIRLRNELAGKEFYDPEIGLSSAVPLAQ